MPSRRSSPPIELSEMLCFDLYAASRALTAAYRPLLAGLGLAYPQYLVLVVLWQGREQTVKQLSETLYLDYGTLTPLLRRMQSDGLITRQCRLEDERSVSIELSAAGAELRLHERGIHEAIRSGVGLNDQQVAALQSTHRSISAATAALA
ncbi:MAG: MarR family transcriptional regulator [Dermatophilaceae bacterium]|nr:MarR family transcriptional regulator [Dermatophilaceae bacterium]